MRAPWMKVMVGEAFEWSFFVFIHEMSERECRAELQKATVGRLACAHNNQPYVVPIYFSLDGKYLYGFTTLGQKTEWMRLNPHVCLEIDERIAHDIWISVVVFGRYEELPDEPEYAAARMEAHSLMQRRAMWWEPAFVASSHRDSPHSITPIFYRIHIEAMTGHRATQDSAHPNGSTNTESSEKKSWWNTIWQHMCPPDPSGPTAR